METVCDWIGIAPAPARESIEKLTVPYLKTLRGGIVLFLQLSPQQLEELKSLGWELSPNGQKRTSD